MICWRRNWGACMAETDLTKLIKMRLRYFRPELNFTNRQVRYAFEVLTPNGGYVDVIRFEDYKTHSESLCRVLNPPKGTEWKSWWNVPEECEKAGRTFPNPYCQRCWHRYCVESIGMLTTCYEVKISKGDFKSENGHNFCGERNYYAMPKALYPQVKADIPPGIGAITYDQETGTMRIARHCEKRVITDEDRVFLLYNSLKKWCGWNQLRQEGIIEPKTYQRVTENLFEGPYIYDDEEGSTDNE